MYKVVIIDDEPKIVEGLSEGIEWSRWNCEVVGSEYDGLRGLMLIRELKPDILISDISMPGMDGLAMIAAFKSEFPDMQISILTGYREFDYARKAIELGVTRYLLKPSKFKEIEEAITVMTDKLSDAFNERITEGSKEDKEEDAPESISDESLSEANSFIVNNAINYMKEHYNEKLKLSDVADKVYVSQWHLSKLLNGHTGKNFSEVLNGIRIEKATQLLKDPSLRISDIAEEVGFLDLAHFSRVFKKICGMSANEYRNKMQIEG